MGAVRIYKNNLVPSNGWAYPWAARSNGCVRKDASTCLFGVAHNGYCNDYVSYESARTDLNNNYPKSLGAYLKK